MSAMRLARGATGRSMIVKFEGCYHGHADALLVKAGSGLATFGHPTSAGVPAEVVQHTLVLEYNNVAQLEEAFALHGAQIACVMIEPIAGNMNFVRASVPFMKRLRELCTQHGALLVFDEVMTGFRVALGGAQSLYAQAHPRLRARHQRVRQGHRRRHAAGGLRRQARGDGAARAARRRSTRPARCPATRSPPPAAWRRCARSPSPASSTRCRARPRDLVDGLVGAARDAGVATGRRQRRRHVRLLLRRALPQNYARRDGHRQGALQPLLPRHARPRRLPRAGAVRSRLRQRRAQRRRHRGDGRCEPQPR